MPIHIEVVTQEKKVFEEEAADMIILPGKEGVLGVLPRHTPLLTTLDIGELRIKAHGTEHVLAVYGGIVEIRPDKVVVLADMAEHAEEIDQEKAEEARRTAQEMMRKGPPPDEAAIIMQELRHAELALRVRRRAQSRAGTVTLRPDGGE